MTIVNTVFSMLRYWKQEREYRHMVMGGSKIVDFPADFYGF